MDPTDLCPPTPEPRQIEYKHWKHKTKGYLVEVYQVLNHRGQHGYYTTVEVIEKPKVRRVLWPAGRFLRTFEPQGRKMRKPSRGDLIDEDL